MLGVDHKNYSVMFNKTAQTSALRTILRKRSLLGFFFDETSVLLVAVATCHLCRLNNIHAADTKHAHNFEKFLSHFAD